MSTGFVTTARATHASPSPLYAHSVSGDWESDKDKLEEAKDDATNCPDIGIVVLRRKKIWMVPYFRSGLNISGISLDTA